MKKVLICGLGAVGLTYAMKFKGKADLKILVDEYRLERYLKNKPVFNNIEQDFDYILPSSDFRPDLIIIATKAQGLVSAIKNIKNFVQDTFGGTIILSLLNGISSEEMIKAVYPQARVLRSYFIGHSAVRVGNSVTQDGVGEIVTEEKIELFDECAVNYSVSSDIIYSMWLKYTMNLFSNQVSAILNMTFGDMKKNKAFISFARKIIAEVQAIAEQKGVNHPENLEKDALEALNKMCDEGTTSMLQDILARRMTEVDIFAGEMIKMGKEFGIPVPCNQVLYDLIRIKEEDNEYSIHSC